MKTFAFIIEPKRYPKEICHIYRIKNNLPEKINTIEWRRGAYAGPKTEVLQALAESGEIPKRFEKAYYHTKDLKNFRIVEL